MEELTLPIAAAFLILRTFFTAAELLVAEISLAFGIFHKPFSHC